MRPTTLTLSFKRLAACLVCLAIAAVAAPALAAPERGIEAQSCSELVVNGGFESGSQGWTQSSAGGYDLVSTYNPFTGVWGAYLGGIDDADDRLGQALTLPAGASSITLHAWWSIATSETGGGFDRMTLSLLRPDGSLLAELARIDDSADPDVWDEIIADLTSYAGQTVRVQAHAVSDGSNPTDFYLDDLGITACVASGTATPTPTRIATPTPTATPRVQTRYGYLPLVVAAR